MRGRGVGEAKSLVLQGQAGEFPLPEEVRNLHLLFADMLPDYFLYSASLWVCSLCLLCWPTCLRMFPFTMCERQCVSTAVTGNALIPHTR